MQRSRVVVQGAPRRVRFVGMLAIVAAVAACHATPDAGPSATTAVFASAGSVRPSTFTVSAEGLRDRLRGAVEAPARREAPGIAQARGRAIATGLRGLASRPSAAVGAATSEGVALIGAASLHAQGVRGQGQRVAVISYGFDGYAALQGTDLPAAVQVQNFRADGVLTGSTLGTAAAEVAHDVAPDAELALVAYDTKAELVSALQWTAALGFDVAVVSDTLWMWEPNDGKGAIAAAANAARAAGVLVVADAGAFGDGHYVATFTQWGYGSSHSFGEGDVMALGGDGATCPVLPKGTPLDVTLIWNDWGSNPASPTCDTDYDLYLVYWNGTDWAFVDRSDDAQNGNDAPVERIYVASAPYDACYGVWVDKYDATGSETLHLYSFYQPWQSDLQHPEQSVVTPCVGADVLCVGTTDLTDALRSYSSRGPGVPNEQTGAQTQKPDLVAPDGVHTASSSPDGLYDPAIAAAHVAGAAALALQLSNGDVAAAATLLSERALDLGSAGFDASFGYGRVNVEPPCIDADCDDGQPCTDDHCEAGACVHTARPNGERCGAAGDACAWTECWWSVCAAREADNHVPCDDGSACTVGDECLLGVCTGGVATTCGPASECRAAGACNPATGVCEAPALADGSACSSDDDPCTVDACQGGECVHGAVADDCGLRQCGPSPSGCHTCGTCPEGFGCGADGLCTDSCAGVTCDPCQACHAGSCVPQAEGSACASDGNPCTADVCTGGACGHAAVAPGSTCSDGDACTVDDACDGTVCVPGAVVTCALPGPCQTGGACDPATGACIYDVSPDWTTCPDDGNTCTDDLCLGGTCRHNARVDGATCEADGLACTSDTCKGGQCLHPVTNACLIGGVCQAAGSVEPGNACRACQPALDASAWTPRAGAACDDGNACTLGDACAGGACVAGAPLDCGPPAPCHHPPTCAPATGACTSAAVANGTVCSDGLACTAGEACKSGACVGGQPVTCVDFDGECTAGVCREDALGCVAEPRDAGLACGEGPACADGLWSPGHACDHSGVCAPLDAQSCAPYAACADATACATSCSADDQCVEGSACLAGVCRSNGAPSADAGVDQVAGEGATITLDGRASDDPDGDALTFAWTQVSGPGVTLDDVTSDTPTFQAPTVTSAQPLVFRLVVADPWESGLADETTVTIENTVNEPPEADAGTDVTANESDLVTLYGTGSSDPNGDALTYAWSLESGPAIVFEGTTAIEGIAVFRAPLVNGDKAVVVKLVVNDGQLNSVPDTVAVTLRDRDAPTTGPDAQGGFEHDVAAPDTLSDDVGADASGGWTIDVGAVDTAANAAGGGSGSGSGCAFTSTTASGGSAPVGLGVLLLALLGLRYVLRRRDPSR